MSEEPLFDPRIEDLLDRWEDAKENGEPLTVDDLCREHPDLIDELKERIATLESFEQLVGVGTSSDSESVPDSISIQQDIDRLRFANRGGLGMVCRGLERKTGREVAIKFLHGHLSSDAECQNQFVLEAKVTAKLEHPGVVPMYGIGRDGDSRPFYAMRWIEGKSMDEAIGDLHTARPRRWRPEHDRQFRDLLNRFVSVCKTIAYAHNRGIVHCDIKPANIMLGRYGETLMVDWGLATPVVREEPFRASGEKSLMPSGESEESSGRGSSARGAGTPAYMSPEQASSLAPTPATDIYSLGATLYKLICGRTAVDGDDSAELKRRVIEGDLIPMPHEIAVPPPLAAIVDKAMQHRPVDRYPTALKMADDIEAYLADQAVTAYQEGSVERVSRLSRRHRSATLVLVVATVFGAILASLAALRFGDLAHRERQAHFEAESARNEADRHLKESLGRSAGFLAQSIGHQIDLSWRILESESNSPALVKLLEDCRDAINENDTALTNDDSRIDFETLGINQDALQSWLQERFIKHRGSVDFESWFIQAIDGTQIARAPKKGSVGRNYRHRDYFHGQGNDLDPQTIDDPPIPLFGKSVHLSNAYVSTNSNTLKVTFSVPVFADPTRPDSSSPLGVLGMTIEAGRLKLDTSAWLVDMRRNQFDQRRGLLLQHPRMGTQPSDKPFVFLSEDWESGIEEGSTITTDGLTKISGRVLKIVDPIDQSERLAAVADVTIGVRDSTEEKVGWMVVVTE